MKEVITMNTKKLPDENEINNLKLTENFMLKEFECPCCHRVMVHPKLVKILQLTREHLGRPIVIDSGYRCNMHNNYIGGTEFSKHLIGEAVDVKATSDKYAREFIDMLMEYQEDVRYKWHEHQAYIHVELK
jgi:uncharacterized protein YcbK (DUF882 family)